MEANEEIKAMEVDFEGIMMSLGKVGKYQVIHFLWMVIPVVLCSIHVNNYIFATADTNYRCEVKCDIPGGKYDTPWLPNAIPMKNKKYEKCEMYKIKEANASIDICPFNFDTTSKVKCDQYIYESSDTFIEEMNIPCKPFELRLIGTLHSLGTLLALPIIGFISDKYGRKFLLVVSSVLEGILGIIKGFSPNYVMFATMEIIEPTLGSGVYTAAYVLSLEMLLPLTRVAGSADINIMFALGQVFLGFIAWGIPYFRTFIFVIYAPSLLLLTYWWIVDESARWLLSNGRYVEALTILTKIANTNKVELPEKQLEPLRYNVEHIHDIKKTHKKNKKEEKRAGERSPFQQVIRSRILLLRVLKCSVWWITCTLCFYGLSINSVSLSDKVHMNFILSGCVEIPSHIAGYFGMTYFGRKRTIFTAYLIAGVCLISSAFIPTDITWLATVLYLVGKFCVTAAFGSVYLYTSELFPTPVRHSLLAACSMVGRIGSVLAPMTPLLKKYLDSLPSIIFASTCLISALLMLTSPETLGRKLPETIEEAENITNKKKDLENSPAAS